MHNNCVKSIFILLSLIFANGKIMMAQTGPAGVGNAGGTSGQPTNIMWLDASSLGLSNNAPVTNWTDRSGNGYNATQATAVNQPLYKTNYLNGRPVIYFDNSVAMQQDRLDFDGNTLVNTDYTVIVVGARRSLGSKRWLGGTTDTGPNNTNLTVGWSSGTQYTFDQRGNNVSATPSIGAAINTFGIFTHSLEAGASSARRKLFQNGNLLNSNNSNVRLASYSGAAIGRFGPAYYDIDVAEVIFYKSALNTVQRTIVENYLSQKYNIAVAKDYFGNDTDYNPSYSNNIRGIGSDGANKRTNSFSSGGLSIRENAGSLDANEYVMLAHSGTAHATTTANRADVTNIANRWSRDWYVERNLDGGSVGVDGGDMSVQMVFDFAEAGLTYSGNLSNYVLLYRSTATGNFDRIYADSYTLEGGNKIVVSVPSSRLSTGYYTLGTGTPLLAKTWYVFQDGNWSDPNTWTTDASTAPLYKNPGGNIPGATDEVIIRSGRTVTIQSTTNNQVVNSIKVDGNLHLTNSTGHNFNVINGGGIIRMAGYNPGSGLADNFPAGVTSGNMGFSDADNGGTLVVYAAADIILNTARTFRHMRIELINNTSKAILGANITLNGDLEVRNGNLQFGDGTATGRTLTVNGDVLVTNNGSTRIGSISTSTANATHTFDIKGDFTNNGDVRFTNRADFPSVTERRNHNNSYYSNSAADGIVNVFFTSDNANQTVNCNSLTYFYRIIVDKGVDDTYKLALHTTNIDYFRLLGPANDDINSDQENASQNSNAFALVNGTAEIGSNIEIPVLNRASGSNYAISSTTRLWINGGDVRKTAGTAIVPYGKVQVSAGYLEARVNSGLTVRENGLIIVDGGSVFANQIRTSTNGSGSLGGYQQSGGSVVVDGSATGGNNGSYYIFSMTYTGNVFLMSGGTLTVRGMNSSGAIFINSDPGNTSVTGGTVIVESSNSNTARITSRAPFYNVYMRASAASVGNVALEGGTSGTGGGGGTVTLPNQPLVVINDLIIHGHNDSYYNNPLGNFPVSFFAVTSDTNINDVYVGGSLYVGRNSTYQTVFGGSTPYNNLGDLPTHFNTTYFNQTVASSVIDTLYWGVSGGQLELGNFVLNKGSGNELRTIARNGDDGDIRFDVNGNASVLSGTLDQNAYTFRIWGSITNYDRLGTYYSSGSYPKAGGTPSLAQIRFREDPPVVIHTNDDAVFGNVRFNVGSGTTVELNSNVYIERMEYLNGRIYVKSHTLTVDEVWNINNGGGAYFNNDEANSSIIRVGDTGITANILVFTDGKASDGGLRLKIRGNTVAEDLNSRINNNGPITFPVGFTPDGGTTFISRPAQMKVRDFADSGYVKINVVSGELQTTDLAGGEILQHYWRVSHSDFSTLPTVAFRFYYRGYNPAEAGRDRPALASNENNYVPGYVLDGGTYTRYFESNPTQDITDIFTSTYQGSGVNNRTRIITFNGSSTGGEFTQAGFSGFTLASANFTAGVATRFIGSPRIYYSSTAGVGNDTDFNNNDKWTQSNRWSTVGHFSTTNSGTYPQAGDIAILGFGLQNATSTTDNAQRSHWYFVDQDINAASLVFANSVRNQNGVEVVRDNSFSPQLIINNDAAVDVSIGTVEGAGTFNVEVGCAPCNANPASSTAVTANVSADFGLFANEESSRFDYDLYISNNTAVYLPASFPEIYPNVNIKGQNNNRTLIFQEDITINRDLTVREQAILRLSDLAEGDITVRRNLRFDTNDRNDRVEFPSAGPGRTLRVEGDIIMKEDDRIEVLDNNNAADVVLHRLQVGGNIIKADGRIILYNGPEVNRDHAILELIGTSNAEYTSTNNANDRIISMYKLQMNKGTNRDATFTFQENFRITDATSTFQPIEILNGTLVLNASTINPQNVVADRRLLLANGSNFLLPNTTNPLASSGSGGLELRQGIARVIGANTGILLDGLLRVSGGTLDMDGGAGVNNFIEYSSSGQASLEVSGGTLTVGSQVRRGLNSNTGVLQYVQSGGTMVVGKNAAPESSRGVFEITNGGSYFEHTGGSLTLVRHNNSTTIPSLLLDPEDANIADGTVITIGNSDTPVNQNRFGIQSSIDLAELYIASANVDAKLYNLPLSTHILNIANNVDFDANGFDLTIYNSLQNEGRFVTSGSSINGQTTIFPVTTNANIMGGGTTTFWNFEKSGSGTLSLSKNVTVANNAFIYEGTLNTQSSAFNVKKDLLHDAIHTSAATGPGILFNGTQQQILDRSGPGTSELGVINLNNASGLLIRDTDENFQVNGKCILTSGVLDIGGNLLIFSSSAGIENGTGGTTAADFNVNNMIQTNSAIRDFGIRKFFNAVSGGNATFTYPVGLTAYTPVVVNISDISASSITIRPVKDIPPIAEDAEYTFDGTSGCEDPNITDADNVLQYYWIVKSSGVSGFVGDILMYYDPNDIQVTSPYTVANYGPARIYNSNDNWDKVFTTSDFNEITQEISFPFTGNGDATLAGIYTAGVTLRNDGTTLLCGAAIPDQVPLFTTNDSGGGNFFVGTTYTGGIAPVVGETPDITIQDGDVLVYNQNSIRTRKITIESGGTLIIQNGTSNHNLGFVTGEGTIRLESNTSSVVFPTGDYEEFFPDEYCNGGGGLEYAGSGNYPVLSDLTTIRRVIFSGSGHRTLPNNFVFNVCEDFDIRGAVNIIVPDGNNATTVRGNIYKSDGSDFDSGIGNSRMIMRGSSAQSIRGDFTGTDAFNELEINNAAGVTIVNAADATRGISANQDVVVDKTLILTNGILTTNSENTLTINTTGASVGYTGGSSASFVSGPLTKNNIGTSMNFQFPIGKSGRYSPAAVVTPSAGNQNWTAEYFTTNQRGRTSFDAGSGSSALTDISNDMWRITSSGNNAARVRVHWNASSNVSDINDMRVVYWDDKSSHPYPSADNDAAQDRWENKGGSGVGSTSNGNVTSQGLIPFSTTDVALGSSITVLPVELISFAVKMKDRVALLQWVTASEKNNDFFEVQRSLNGKDWTTIGIVEGAGDSQQELSYTYTDKNPVYGISYYRLRQVDFDGQFEYSNVIVLENVSDDKELPQPEVLLYPNPAQLEKLIIRAKHLQIGQEVEVSLSDIYGKQYIYAVVMPEELEKGIGVKSKIELPIGVYLVSIRQHNIRIQKKLILKKY